MSAPEQDADTGCGPTVFASVTFSSRSTAASLLTLPEVMIGEVAGHRWVTVISTDAAADPDQPLDVEAALARYGLELTSGREVHPEHIEAAADHRRHAVISSIDVCSTVCVVSQTRLSRRTYHDL